MRRDELAQADDEYWALVELSEAIGKHGGHQVDSAIAEQRYRAARVRAMASGFKYMPLDSLVRQEEIEDIVARLKAVESSANENTIEKLFCQSHRRYATRRYNARSRFRIP